MYPVFKFKTLAIAITSLTAASFASAAGLDRSGQDSTAFLQDGTYAEVVYTYIDADISGHDNANPPSSDINNPTTEFDKGNDTGDIAEYYDYTRFAVKTDLNDTVSVGVLYDQPFGAAAHYKKDSNFVSNDATNLPGTLGSTDTNVKVNTYNLTGLVGLKVGDNFQVYGGPAFQRLEGDVHLRGSAYGGSRGYDAHLSPDDATGWVAGLAFKKPEIGLRAALTYRSEIDHENPVGENIPILGILPQAQLDMVSSAADRNNRSKVDVTTPESFNLDFQTGINKTTLATAHVRYVPWSDFSIVPPQHNALTQLVTRDNEGVALVDYSDDQWKIDLGLAKRLTPSFAVSGSVGWDSGAGNPATSLGPIEGFYSVGVGAKYNFTPKWAISAGAKYLMLGDAEGALTTGNVVSKFEDNDGVAVGIKLSYQDK